MLPVAKLETILRRFHELEHLLCSPAVLNDLAKLQKLNKERTDLSAVVEAYEALKIKQRELGEATKLIEDPDFREMAFEEVNRLKDELGKLEKSIELLLLPKDPNDER